MKRILMMLMMAVSAVVLASCEGKEDNNGQTDPSTPEGDGFYEFPLTVEKEGFQAASNGVSIAVSSVKENNLVFNLIPGTAVKSYRVDVYPKAMLYNLLLNEGCVDGTAAECEDKIIQLLSNSSSAGSHVFTSSDSDFAEKEFDWANTEYSTAAILPDCDYYILVLGCYDVAGSNPASLRIAEVTTSARPIAGDPQIAVEAETGYRAFIVRYHPNEDCKYFYHWIWSTDEMSEYIDLFGDRMMRDFCRSAVSEAYDAALEDNLYVKRTFDTAEGLERENTVIAVATDANGTPSQEQRVPWSH